MPERHIFSSEKKSKKISPEEEQRLFETEQAAIAKKPIVSRDARLKTSDSTWRKVAALSLALHGGAVEAAADFPVTRAVMERASSLASRPKENFSGVAFGAEQKVNPNSHGLFGRESSGKIPDPASIRAAMAQTKEGGNFNNFAWGINGIAIEKGPHGEIRLNKKAYAGVDFSKFFLTHEYRRGKVSAEDARRIDQDFTRQLSDYKNYYNQLYTDATHSHAPDWDELVLKTIHRIMSEQGDYDGHQPTFGRIIDSSGKPGTHVGDCKARADRGLAFIVGVFNSDIAAGDIEIFLEISGDPHRRLIVKHHDTWYVAEGGIRPLLPEEIRGRVFVSPNNFLASEFGLEKRAMLPPSHEAPDAPGPGGDEDGFNLLPPGVRPTKNVFGGAPTLHPQKFVPKTFEEMQKRPGGADLEITFIDAVAPAPNEKLLAQAEFAPRTFHLSTNDIMSTEITGHVGGLGKEIQELSGSNSYDPVQDPEKYQRQQRFLQLSKSERQKFIRESKIDISPINDLPIESIEVLGGQVDFSQLKNLESARKIIIDEYAYATHLDQLVRAKKVEEFVWNGKSYSSQEIPSVEKIFASVVPEMKSLRNLNLSNAPLQNADWLRGLPIVDLSLDNLTISDLGFIATIPILKTLNLGKIPATDLMPIQAFIENPTKNFSATIYNKNGLLSFGGIKDMVRQQNYHVRFESPNFDF